MSNNRFLRLPLTAARPGCFFVDGNYQVYFCGPHASRVARDIALKLSQRTVDAFELERTFALSRRHLSSSDDGNAAFSYRRSGFARAIGPSVCIVGISARERGH